MKPNNSRRIVQSEAHYYNSEKKYTFIVWDNPILHEDSLVEMVPVTENTLYAMDEVTDMLVDNARCAEESRRSKSRTKDSIRENE